MDKSHGYGYEPVSRIILNKDKKKAKKRLKFKIMIHKFAT